MRRPVDLDYTRSGIARVLPHDVARVMRRPVGLNYTRSTSARVLPRDVARAMRRPETCTAGRRRQGGMDVSGPPSLAEPLTRRGHRTPKLKISLGKTRTRTLGSCIRLHSFVPAAACAWPYITQGRDRTLESMS
ncbi:hypothetical protein FKM82_008348 [Ascaphus truei]